MDFNAMEIDDPLPTGAAGDSRSGRRADVGCGSSIASFGDAISWVSANWVREDG